MHTIKVEQFLNGEWRHLISLFSEDEESARAKVEGIRNSLLTPFTVVGQGSNFERERERLHLVALSPMAGPVRLTLINPL